MCDGTILGALLFAAFINIVILSVITWKILLIRITTLLSRD